MSNIYLTWKFHHSDVLEGMNGWADWGREVRRLLLRSTGWLLPLPLSGNLYSTFIPSPQVLLLRFSTLWTLSLPNIDFSLLRIFSPATVEIEIPKVSSLHHHCVLSTRMLLHFCRHHHRHSSYYPSFLTHQWWWRARTIRNKKACVSWWKLLFYHGLS